MFSDVPCYQHNKLLLKPTLLFLLVIPFTLLALRLQVIIHALLRGKLHYINLCLPVAMEMFHNVLFTTH